MIDYKIVCDVLGISPKTFYNKYNGKTEYTLTEILQLYKYFKVPFITLVNKIKKNGVTENETDYEKTN